MLGYKSIGIFFKCSKGVIFPVVDGTNINLFCVFSAINSGS